MPAEAGRPIVAYGVSRAADPAEAVAEALAGFDLASLAFLMVFVPHGMPLPELERELTRQGRGTTTFGCTTAGQITELGYEDEALVILGFRRRHFRCASLVVSPLKDLVISDVAAEVSRTSERFVRSAGWNRFALIMADGLSMQEDLFVTAIEAGLQNVPVFGGSAGDGLAFGRTHILHKGRFRTDAGLLILVETDLGFVGLGFDHFHPTQSKVVVTSARPEQRIVCELNGSPAAREYARLIGRSIDELSPEVFAENPLLVRNGDTWHVRAVQKVEDNDSLSFLSAIDDGLILSLGRGDDLIGALTNGLSVKDPSGRDACLILGFECILRRLEFAQKELTAEVAEVLRGANVRGFCTYGEQHRGVHVNQTFVGVAFYPPGPGPQHD